MPSSSPRHSVDSALPSPRSLSSFETLPHSTRSPYGGSRRSSASKASSIGGVLDTVTNAQDAIPEDSSNAISTLLLQPIAKPGLRRTQIVPLAPKQPTARDIPPVALTNIPHIEASSFTAYLSQAGSLYEVFRRAKEGDGDFRVQGRRARSASKDEKDRPALFRQDSRHDDSSSNIATSSLLSDATSRVVAKDLSGRRQSVPRRRGPLPVAPLSTIPNIYFESDFHLENPRTFDTVSERAEVVRSLETSKDEIDQDQPVKKRKALATNAILQEKLSWYMDTVEVHLISSISTASSSFFAALGSLRELYLDAAESVAKIKNLRDDLTNVDQNMAQGGLKIVILRRRRENLRKLGGAVQQLRQIVEAVAHVEEQVGNGDVETALLGLNSVDDLIAGRENVLSSGQNIGSAEKSYQMIDLSGIEILEGARGNLSLLEERIGKVFEGRLLDALLKDLRSHIDAVSSNTTFRRWDITSQRARGTHIKGTLTSPAHLEIQGSLRDILTANLDGLARSNALSQATTTYRDALLREIKSIIRRHLPSSTDDDTESTLSASTLGGRRMTQQEKSSVLARNLRDLEPEDAENMLRQIYSNVGEALRRLGTQVKVVLDITSTLEDQSVVRHQSPTTELQLKEAADLPTKFRQEEIQQTLDMSNLLGQAVDIAQTQITKVLKVRAEQTISLELPRFLQYFHLNRLFADECEAVSGRGGLALKTVVNGQIQDFVQRTAGLQRQKLVDKMDGDRWDARDLTQDEIDRLQNVIDASTSDITSWSRPSIIWSEPFAAMNGTQLHQHDSKRKSEVDMEKVTRSAVIDGEKFILTGSGIIVLDGICVFEQMIVGISSMTQEITKALLDYLKLFNSRSQQLILGAGATRIAGLKNITTKHLSLASQGLSFVIALIPHLRDFIRRYLANPQGLMIEFDKIEKLYQDHQTGINDKLVEIMSSRATTHVAAMRQVQWDVPTASEAINTYMETLIKETTTLQKVLAKHLPAKTVEQIMGPVFASYNEQWTKAFEGVDVKTADGKVRLLRDADYFRTRLSKIDGSGNIGNTILDVVRRKISESEPQVITDTTNETDVKDVIDQPHLVNGSTA